MKRKSSPKYDLCLQCGNSLKRPDGTLADICPFCGQPQALANPLLRRTR